MPTEVAPVAAASRELRSTELELLVEDDAEESREFKDETELILKATPLLVA